MKSPELFPLHSEQHKPKDLNTILQSYLRYWYWFLISAIIALAVAFAYLRYYATPEYGITSTLLIGSKTNSPVFPGEDAIAKLSEGGSAKDLNNEIEILKSKSLAEKVAKDLSLFTTYRIKGRVRDIEVYGDAAPINVVIGELKPAAYSKTLIVRLKPNNGFELQEGEEKPTIHKLGQLIHTSYGSFTIVAPPATTPNGNYLPNDIIVQFNDVKNAANYISGAVKIAPINKEATILMVSLTDAVPKRGKDIINKLLEIYDKEAVEYKNRNAANTVAFLDERLKFITSELSGVEKNVEQFKRRNEVADVSSQASNYIEQASAYNKQLSDWAIQIDVLESIEKYLNKTSGQYTMVPSSLGIQDATLLGLIAKFNSLQLERERMLRTTEASNPLVQNINEQLENLRTNILENLQNIKRGLIITSRNLKASSGQFRSQIKNVPSIERELLEINRQQTIKQALYSFLLQKREEASLELAGTVSNSRVIDPAISTDFPISPNKQLLYLMAILIGLSIPFAIIYVKELLNDKVRNIEDVQDLTNVPILGELEATNAKEHVVVTKDNRTPIAEMFRLIRANFIMLNRNNKVVLVTSSMSGEGKTFFSINLASSLILTEKKVVLLELDLRNSDLAYILGVNNKLGITNYLNSADLSISDILQPSETVPGLQVISSGPTPENPSELLMSSKLAYLITELREQFDYIILDTAPVGKVADVFGLSAQIDSSIYIVRCNYTYKKMLNIISDIFTNRKLNNPMIVVNAVKKKDSNSYGYGYEYNQKKAGSSSAKSRKIAATKD
jgi:capsular exopolysaccharide synthesis family protein